MGFAIFLFLCVGCSILTYYWAKGIIDEHNKEYLRRGPTKNPEKYTGPEDEPEWQVYTRRLSR